VGSCKAILNEILKSTMKTVSLLLSFFLLLLLLLLLTC